MRIVCSDEAQKRLTVVPGTVSGQVGEQRHPAREVHALPLLGEAAADHHVDDLLARELRHLLQRGVDGEGREVVGPGVDQGALARAADRRARGGDDHCFRQRRSLPSGGGR